MTRATTTIVHGDQNRRRFLSRRPVVAFVIFRFSPWEGSASLRHLSFLFWLGPDGRRRRRFVAYATNYRLVHGVNPLRSVFTGFGKTEFGTCDGAGHTDRQAATQIALNVCGFVPLANGAPGIHAKHREIAGLAFAATRSCHQILRRFTAGPVQYAIQLEPRYHVQISGAGIISHGTRQIRFYKPGEHPTGDWGSRLACHRGSRLRALRTATHGVAGRLGYRRGGILRGGWVAPV